jgi:hypothetical protein
MDAGNTADFAYAFARNGRYGGDDRNAERARRQQKKPGPRPGVIGDSAREQLAQSAVCSRGLF